MFLGQFEPQFSSNSKRLSIPVKLRSGLTKNKVILSKGFDQCIFGYSADGWEAQSAKHLENPISDQTGRDLRRFIFSASEEVDFDKQGRIVIPKTLIDYAEIDQLVTVIGAGDHFEIWSTKKWKEKIYAIDTKNR